MAAPQRGQCSPEQTSRSCPQAQICDKLRVSVRQIVVVVVPVEAHA
jgi:hypothetical protein